MKGLYTFTLPFADLLHRSIIDKEHQLLFGKFNELEEALNSHSLDKAGEILGFIQFYSDLHFSEEEKEMEAKRCPLADINKREHDIFRRQFSKFYEEWQNGNESIAFFKAVYIELEKWVPFHITEVDSHLQFNT